MRRILLTVLVLFAGMNLSAGDYNPTSTWPYLYEDFQQGTIYMVQGTKLVQQLNIHCAHGKLHFLDKDIIKEAVPKDITMVEIAGDKYVSQSGVMYRILASNDNGMVVASILGDFNALNETGGAYGTSSTSSATTKLSSFEVEGQVNQNHMLILQTKSDGVELNLKTSYYIKTKGLFVKASAKEISALMEEQKAADFKSFLKAHKIKWNKPESVMEVVDFIAAE